jgi:hypothetical protein
MSFEEKYQFLKAIRLISSNAPSTTPDFPEESPASGDRLDEFKGVAFLNTDFS